MRILHVVGYLGGGIKRVIEVLLEIENIYQYVWIVSKRPDKVPEFSKFNIIIFHEYMISSKLYNPEGLFNDLRRLGKAKKIFYSHGLSGLSIAMMLNRIEIKPWRWYNRWKIISWLKQFDHILSVSLTHQYMMKKFYNIDSTVIHNGVNFGLLPRYKNSRRDFKTILYIGRIAWRKGVNRFLALMKTLPNYQGIILGINPRELYSYKIPSNVRIVGRVHNPYKYIVESSYVVNVSYYDPLSIAVLESLHYGTPVLVLKDSGGPWEILQLLGEYEWGFDTLEQMANYIKNSNWKPFRKQHLLHTLFGDTLFKEKFVNFINSLGKT